MAKAKPFIKWAGGKGHLLEQLNAYLPEDFGDRRNVTYIEPFVGGGAMLFYMLQRYPNIQHAVINDVNIDLTTCYQTVRDTPEELIDSLLDIQNAYDALQSEEGRRDFFLTARDRYNEKNLDPIENTTKFIFLNRTCFNGLYRVNRRGLFNVPFGRYINPQICDPATIRLDSELLQRVEILTGDFEETLDHTGDGYNFFYFDPPYRPLSATSSFNSYSREDFNDEEQIRLRDFCARLNGQLGIGWMLSNADCSAKNPEDRFFEEIYADFFINRVYASRAINANPSKRGKLTELLICNYRPEIYGAYAAEEI
ncbi:MAG: DNA adenine methylase [Aeriscardovia sp.]|nr:DNA adenine methylase [Aeriscardovia sp.]